MIIGKRVKEARISKKYSQQELGDLLGVTKVSICGYENGTRQPTLDTFLKLLDTLEIDSNYLLGREENVVCEGEEKYTKQISKIDLDIIRELKKYPNLYKELCNNLNRTVEKISKKI